MPEFRILGADFLWNPKFTNNPENYHPLMESLVMKEQNLHMYYI